MLAVVVLASLTVATPAPDAARDVAGARDLAQRFVSAVNRGRPDELCRLLRGRARGYPGCDHGRDIGPLLNLAIDGPRDIRLVRVGERRAVAHIPSPASYRRCEKGWEHPQTVIMRKCGADGWRVVELRLAVERCG